MLNRGSEWRRWEPHIHAPGTVMILSELFIGRVEPTMKPLW